jgi:hypothetical protein
LFKINGFSLFLGNYTRIKPSKTFVISNSLGKNKFKLQNLFIHEKNKMQEMVKKERKL